MELARSGKSLLWEISGKALEVPSYFLGTMHLVCADNFELSKSVKQVIKNTEQIYLEVDLSNANEIFEELLERRDKNKLTLSSVLSAAEYHTIKTFFEDHQPHLSFRHIEKQPPLMISSALYEFLMPCEQKNGVELKILEHANIANKPVFGLETIDFQISIFDSIPYEEQAKDLIRLIENLEKNREYLLKMMSVYQEQDVEGLFTLTTADLDITSSYLDLLVNNRNEDWVKKFHDIATVNSTLFAVGAGHLGGEMGVLSLLRKEGYKVSAVKN